MCFQWMKLLNGGYNATSSSDGRRPGEWRDHQAKSGALTLTVCSWGNHGNIRTQFRCPFMTSDYHPDNG